MRIRILLVASILLQGFFVMAQNKQIIKGMVKDAKNGEVMPFANVFLAETTYGTSTDDNGSFVIEVTDLGNYDLIVKFIGYETSITKVQVVANKVLELAILIEPELKDLGAVVITSKDDRKRSEYLNNFKQEFFGFSKNAVESTLLNEDDLDFSFDKKSNVLKATSSTPLIIENNALGYKFKYFLEEFAIDYNSKISGHFGYASFEEMTSDSKRFKRKWKRNREVAYLGSDTHFFSALHANRLKEEGYKVRFARQVDGVEGLVLDREDSDLNIYVKHDSETGLAYLGFDDVLYITFENEYESVRFQEYNFRQGVKSQTSPLINGDWSRPPQKSKITMRKGFESIVFDAKGYVHNPLSFLSEGYWGFEKVGEMLPVNYKPKK